jgi:hypothetical protein
MQELQSFSTSSVLGENARPTTRPPIVHETRFDYLSSLLGPELDYFDPWVVKLAVDGVYHMTESQADGLRELARLCAEKDATLSRLGRGTVFTKQVKIYKGCD